MNRDCNLIFEKYFDIYKPITHVYVPESYKDASYFYDLYQNDIFCIEELLNESGLLNEGIFSNLMQSAKSGLSSAGSAIKDKAQQVGSAISSSAQSAKEMIGKGVSALSRSIAEKLVKLIVSVSSNFQKIIDLIKSAGEGKFKVDANSPEAKEILDYLKSDKQVSKEGYVSNKEFLADLIFTEENLKLVFRSEQVLLEASSGNLKAIDSLAKQVADKIRKLYPKNKKALSNAFVKFNTYFSNYSNSGQQTSVASKTGISQTGKPTKTSKQQTNQQPPKIQKVQLPTSQTQSNSIPKGPGLIQKIFKFVKDHPKMSAVSGAILLGIVVAAFAGTAPVIAPALIAATKGAAAGSAIDVGAQMIKNKSTDLSKVNLQQTAKRAAIGGALGGAGSILATGLGNIASGFSNLFSGSDGSGGSDKSGTDADNTPPSDVNKMSWNNRQNSYHREIMKKANVKNAIFKMGVPFDENGHQLLDDADVDKIASKWKYPAATKTFMDAHQSKGDDPF